MSNDAMCLCDLRDKRGSSRPWAGCVPSYKGLLLTSSPCNTAEPCHLDSAAVLACAAPVMGFAQWLCLELRTGVGVETASHLDPSANVSVVWAWFVT